VRGGEELVSYLLGFDAELSRLFIDAMHHYSDALRSTGTREREARVLRPLINCILRTPKPNYDRAEELAYRAVEINRTNFSLFNLAKVLIHRTYRDPYLNEEGKDAVWSRYEAALESLKSHAGSASSYAEIRAEEAQLVEDWKDAIEWMGQAIAADSRIENRLRRWKIMIRSKVPEYCRLAVEEIERHFTDPSVRADVAIFRVPMLEAMAMGQKVLGNTGNYRVDQFGQGLGGEAKARIIREVGRLDPRDTGFMASLD